MPDALIDLRGKRGLIPGIANDRSIAWGCARVTAALEAWARSLAAEHMLARLDDVGSFAAFLASDGARLVTGNVEYAGAGYHVLG